MEFIQLTFDFGPIDFLENSRRRYERKKRFTDFIVHNGSIPKTALYVIACRDYDLFFNDADQCMLDAKALIEVQKSLIEARKKESTRVNKANKSKCNNTDMNLYPELNHSYEQKFWFGINCIVAYIFEGPIIFAFIGSEDNPAPGVLTGRWFWLSMTGLILTFFLMSHQANVRGFKLFDQKAGDVLSELGGILFCGLFAPIMVLVSPYYIYKYINERRHR